MARIRYLYLSWTIYTVITLSIFYYSQHALNNLEKTRILPQAHSHYSDGVLRMKQFMLDDAIESFEKALEISPMYLDAFIARADVLALQGKYIEAILDLNQAIKICPSRPSLFVKRGDLLFKTVQISKALDDYETALENSVRYHRAYLGRASVYLSLADFKMAEESLKKAFRIVPNSIQAFQVQQQLELTRKKADTLVKSGMAHMSGRRFSQAVKVFGDALAQVPNAPDILFSQSMAHKENGDYKAAIEVISSAIVMAQAHPVTRDQSGLSQLFNHRGVMYAEKKQYDHAINDFSKSIELNALFAAPWDNRGVVFYVRRDFKKAFLDFTKACDLGLCSNHDRVSKSKPTK